MHLFFLREAWRSFNAHRGLALACLHLGVDDLQPAAEARDGARGDDVRADGKARDGVAGAQGFWA